MYEQSEKQCVERREKNIGFLIFPSAVHAKMFRLEVEMFPEMEGIPGFP